MRDTLRVIQTGNRRVKVFIDFWNLLLNAQKKTSSALLLDMNWAELTRLIVQETSAGYLDETRAELAGCYVFGSFSRSDPVQSKRIDKILDTHGATPGIFFNFVERVKKETSQRCSHCGQNTSVSSESGVDIALTVEVTKHAIMREHEYLVLVSDDRDFMPLLLFLRDRGERVIHAATGHALRELRSCTWKQIDLSSSYTHLCNISHDGYLILTVPDALVKLDQAKEAVGAVACDAKIIDITDPSQINDKDLSFILDNQRITFRRPDGPPNQRFGWVRLCDSISQLREELKAGALQHNLPIAIFNGRAEAWADRDWGWMMNAGVETKAKWARFRTDPRSR